MTRRERLERKLEKRADWSAGAEQRAASAFQRAHTLTDGIPFGQPILVGHHSEKRHRNTLRKADNAMRRGCEAADLAKYHSSKATGLETMLERSIFDDDPDAIEQLQARIEALTTERARMKLVNKLYRAKDAEGLAAIGLDLVSLQKRVADVGMSFVRAPFQTYQLGYLGKRIGEAEKRIDWIRKRALRAEKAEAAGGVVVEGQEHVTVTFAEKPDRAVLDALKATGFWWSKGSWYGQRAKLPECVQAAVAPPAEFLIRDAAGVYLAVRPGSEHDDSPERGGKWCLLPSGSALRLPQAEAEALATSLGAVAVPQ